MSNQIAVDKQTVVSGFISMMESQLPAKKQVLESARRARDGCVSESAVQQSTCLFQDRERSLQEYENAIERLRSLQENLEQTRRDFVSVGSLVHLCDEDTGEIRCYLVVPKVGGDKIECQDTEVKSMSIFCPLAKALLGKKEGDEVQFRDKTIEILKIE